MTSLSIQVYGYIRYFRKIVLDSVIPMFQFHYYV